jgi:hypothetical protein
LKEAALAAEEKAIVLKIAEVAGETLLMLSENEPCSSTAS